MKYQSYDNFWQRLHNSAKEKSFPLRVMFELTYRCNFHCKHCYVPKSYRKRRELKTKEVLFVLDELKKIGCFYLGFTGGEPFVREDIMQILWYAKRKGFEVIIYTNGSLIDEALADELGTLRPNKVDITIPGMSNASFERISGIAGSRDKVFNAIKLLRENNVPLGFKTCVLKENESEIKNIRNFVASLGALHRLDDMLSRRLDGSDGPFRYRGTLETTRHSEPAAKGGEAKNLCDDKILRSAGGLPQNDKNGVNDDIRVNSRAISENSRLFNCGVGVSQAAITPLGELKMCLMIDYPRFKIFKRQKTDFKAAWLQLKEFVSSIKPDETYNCDKCGLQSYCKWCPARGWLYNRTFTSCEPESRKNARNTIQNLQFEDA